MTILLCTAQDMLLTTLHYRFRKQGWRLEIVENAQQVPEAVKKYLPDLVVVDVELPEYSGLDIVQSLRRSNGDYLPVLVIGPLEEERILLEAVRLGADDFILQPCKPDELVLRIRRLLLQQKIAG